MIKTLLQQVILHIAIFVTITICIGAGCSSSPAQKERLERAERVVSTYPDSALTILEDPLFKEITTPKLKALHSLLYSMALDKSYVDISSDSIIRYAVNYYSKRSNKLRKAQSYYYLGTVFYNAGEITKAAENYLRAKEAATNAGNSYLHGQICNTLGIIYYKQNLFEEAAELYKESGKLFKSAGYNDKYANALSYAAKSYYLNGDDSTAIELHNKAIGIYRIDGNTDKITLNTLGIADILLENKEIESAVKILTKCYNKYHDGIIPKRHYPIWSKIYFEQEQYDSSKYYANRYVNESNIKDDDAKAGTLLILCNILSKQGNYKEALKWNEEYTELKNRLYKEKEENHIKEIEAKYTRDTLSETYHALQKRHKRHTIISSIAYTILIIISIAITAVSRRIVKKIVRKRDSDIKFYKELVRTLQEHINDVEERYQLIKSGHIADSCDEAVVKAYAERLDALKDIMDYAYISESTPEKFYKKFREYINRNNKDDYSFSDLQFIANKKHHGIIDYLRENYPNLNQSDLNYCSMICLGFTTNAMRVIYGHTNNASIYNRRSRIHRKLDIGTEHLETFLERTIEDIAKNRL
ncbi:MAG: tetratricopeptide repeat protein [Bacteroidales bacterium]|nr:tetratricopeptide repeat protein [Bacteroidales bacterium]